MMGIGPPRGWVNKFVVAVAGVGWAVRTQNSFWIHLAAAVAVIVLGAVLSLGRWQWTALAIAITGVLAAELFNSAIEQLVKALHPRPDETIGRALDVAAGAVLIAAIGSVAVGLIVLGPPLWHGLGTLLD